MRILQKSSTIAFLINAFFFGAIISNAQTQTINVSVNRAKVERGQSVEMTVRTKSAGTPTASLLKPSIGIENLPLQKIEEGVYHAKVETKADAPAGLYVIHVWTGEKENPTVVGKASFRVGNIVADYFVVNYLDKQKPAEDLDNYLKDFRSVGGNFLVAHNLIISTGAFYPSNVARTSI